jgi:hypothetical protein
MKHRIRLLFALCVALSLCGVRAADIREGLVSYWPLDALAADFQSTPDVVSANDLLAVSFLDNSAVVSGTRGNAFQFDGDLSQRHLYLITPDGTDNGLPISRARTYSILMWVKGKGTGQSDRNIFSESSSVNTDPLLDFGTHSAGTDDTLDFFVRNTGTQINHARTTVTPLDDQWHHMAWTDNNGQIRVYVDGQLSYSNNITHGPTPKDTTSIAATVRLSSGTPIQNFYTGIIDDVSVWERVLSQGEVQNVMTNGIQTPVPPFAPVINRPPQGATNLLIGDTHIFNVAARGTRPFTYQWRKDGTPIGGVTTSTLTLTNLAQSDSGDYTVVVGNGVDSVTSDAATLLVTPVPPPNLTNGMVSYWPLDEVLGGVLTPDLVRSYDMQLINMTAANVVPGRWGNAFRFNGTNSMLERVHGAQDELPIYTKYRDLTVSIWVNGPPNQQDKRVFSEASTSGSNPLFNLGTPNNGSGSSVDVYIRNDANQQGGHDYSILPAYDDTWHHVVYVHREVGGVMQAALYIDNVKDDVVLDPRRPLTAFDTSIGGVRRGSDAAPSRQFIFTGLIDDVAVWKRALSAEEIGVLYTNGTPAAPAVPQPLFIRRFQADLPAVATGDSVTLRWTVNRQATEIEIDQGVGSVLANTVGGFGSVTVPITGTRTFTLTIRRGTETLTAQTTVAVVDGIASNWALLDNFETYQAGPFSIAYWADLGGNSQIVDVNGNKMLDMRGTARIAVMSLNDLKVTEGQTRTLFARVYPQGDVTQNIRSLFGLTDRSPRSVGDATDAGGIGPSVRVSNEAVDLMIGARNGVGALVDFVPPVLETNQIYGVWIDVTNAPIATGDIYSVYVQKEGDASRTLLFTDYVADRDPNGDPPGAGGTPTGPDLNKAFVGNNDVNAVFFDDFYISKSGYNATIPRPFAVAPPQITTATIANGNIVIQWSGGGTLQSSPALGPSASWTGADSDGSFSEPAIGTRFYRVQR